MSASDLALMPQPGRAESSVCSGPLVSPGSWRCPVDVPSRGPRSRDDFNSHISGPIEVAALRGTLCADCSDTIAICTLPGPVFLEEASL